MNTQYKYAKHLSISENRYIKMHHFKTRMHSNLINAVFHSHIEIEYNELVEIWRDIVEMHPQLKNKYVQKKTENSNSVEYLNKRKGENELNWFESVLDLSKYSKVESDEIYKKTVIELFDSSEEMWRVFYFDKHNFKISLQHIVVDNFSAYIIARQLIRGAKSLKNFKENELKINYVKEFTSHDEYVHYMNYHFKPKIVLEEWEKIFSKYQFLELQESLSGKFIFNFLSSIFFFFFFFFFD